MDPRCAALRRLTDRVVHASGSKTPLEIRGGHTKAFYGGTAYGDVVDVRELTGITSYEPTELVVTALAGTSLSEVEAELESRGQCLPFEPPHFGAEGTLGGMVAAGLAGPARASVGALRDFVLGVSLLGGKGDLLSFGGQVMKNVAGYDVARVMAGSMGILGILCEISLKVMPSTVATSTVRFELDQAGALSLLNRWAGSPVPLSASSWHAGSLVVRLAGARAAVAGVRARLGGTEIEPGEARRWWEDIRDHRLEFFDMGSTLEHGEVLWRLSVPDTAPPLSLPGNEFIEWGGALRWLRSTAPAPLVRSAIGAIGGHATIFRAIDKSPGVFTALSEPLMAVHRRLKQSFDPAGIFNPGRFISGAMTACRPNSAPNSATPNKATRRMRFFAAACTAASATPRVRRTKF